MSAGWSCVRLGRRRQCLLYKPEDLSSPASTLTPVGTAETGGSLGLTIVQPSFVLV